MGKLSESYDCHFHEQSVCFFSKQPILATLSPSNRTAKKILVIDDNHDAAETLALLLGVLGFDATYRVDGASGVAAARKIVPDTIFLDLGMPGMDGYEVAHQLRQTTELDSCMIVALTAWGDDETKARTSAKYFDAHVTKPASIELLLLAIDARRR